MSFRHLALATLALISQAAWAQSSTSPPLLSEVHTIAAASTGVPKEFSFHISGAGTYQVTLTDLGALLTPAAPLASVKMALTSGSTLVGAPITGAGTLTFTAAGAGDYVARVVGKPGTQLGSGAIGVAVGTADSPSSLYTFSDAIALPGQTLSNGEAVIDDSFTPSSSGVFNVALSDFQLPQVLNPLTMVIVPEGSGTPTIILPDPGTNAMQGSVSLTQGVKYRILAAGLAGNSGGGLFGVSVTSAGSLVYSNTQSVGTTKLAAVNALTAGAHTGLLTDLAFPTALAQLSGAIILNGQLVTNLTAGTVASFTATAANYRLYVSTSAASTGLGAGSYSLQVGPQSGTAEINIARAVAAPGATVNPYSFDTSLASAGAYVVSLTNFPFPASLSSLQLAAVQAGQILGTPLSAAGNQTLNAAAGPISLLVLAAADPNLGGVFDVNVTGGSSSAPLFDQAQGVAGSAFQVVSRPVTITAQGAYLVQATDLGFPANFSTLATLVSQGGTVAGNIYGSDQLVVKAQPGTYFVNLILQPASTDGAGTYGLNVGAAPAPQVTLTASANQIANGGKVTLSWTSQNATDCSASGSWTGSKATGTGSEQTGALTADATFTLMCTGAGGSASSSVNVAVSQPGGGGGHGGGSIDGLMLLSLSAVFGLRAVIRART